MIRINFFAQLLSAGHLRHSKTDHLDIDPVSTVYYNSAVYGREEYDRSVIEPLGSRRRGSEFRRRIRGVGYTQAQEETPTPDTIGAKTQSKGREQEKD